MNKKIGWGTLSVLIFIIALIFPLKLGRTFCLGDILLKSMGLSVWSGGYNSGFRYSVFYSEALFIIGYFVGRIFPGHLGAKLGRILCLVFGLLIGIQLIFLCSFVIMR